MIRIIIYLILIYIIFLLINKIKNNINEYFNEKIEEKDWLEELFDYRQIITIPSRIKHVAEFCESFNIKVTIFDAILKDKIEYNNIYNLKLGEIACALSQEAVLQNFVNSNKNFFLLMEDDNIPLTNPFYLDIDLKLNDIKEYLKNAFNSLPANWDVLYLGRCWDNCAKHIPINEYIVKTHRTLCHHAIGFSKKGAKKVLEAISHPLKIPIDHIVANLTLSGKINSYATILPIFFQNRIELKSTLDNNDHLPICL